MANPRILARMGRGDLTAHGFRSTFRDWAAETGQSADIAEAALAHTLGSKGGAGLPARGSARAAPPNLWRRGMPSVGGRLLWAMSLNSAQRGSWRDASVPDGAGGQSHSRLARARRMYSRAWQEFGPAAFVERATQAADQFAKLRDGETPEMFLRSAGLLFAHWRKALSRLHGEAHEAFVAYCANRDAAQCCVLIGLRDGGLDRYREPPRQRP